MADRIAKHSIGGGLGCSSLRSGTWHLARHAIWRLTHRSPVRLCGYQRSEMPILSGLSVKPKLSRADFRRRPA